MRQTRCRGKCPLWESIRLAGPAPVRLKHSQPLTRGRLELKPPLTSGSPLRRKLTQRIMQGLTERIVQGRSALASGS